jgi:hypothetical protein
MTFLKQGSPSKPMHVSKIPNQRKLDDPQTVATYASRNILMA